MVEQLTEQSDAGYPGHIVLGRLDHHRGHRWNGLEMTMSSMANSVEVSFTWLVLLVLGPDVALVPTSSQLQEHFPRQSDRCDQRG